MQSYGAMNNTEQKFKFSDFRLYLQNTLIERTSSNPSYSLRAFAKHLNIEPSALSKILNGKRRISKKMFTKISLKL